MQIFLSYASQDRALVEPVNLALAADGHQVFFDREDLPPGEEYDSRIRKAIESSDLFIAFLSPDAFDRGSYTITETEIAQRTWPHPHGRVLPVLVRPVEMSQVPAYLRSITFLEPTGNLAASVADVVHQRTRARQRRILTRGGFVAAASLLCGLAYFLIARNPTNATLDGASMTQVPAGEFEMGDGEFDPLRHVYVDAFYIDVHEVTTARYANFLAANGAVAPPDEWDQVELGRDGDLPVIGVSWQDAHDYCEWAQKRLPTEAEWEKAARSTDARIYPWGDDAPTPEHANFLNEADSAYPHGLHRVGAHTKGKSAAGTLDQAGNASEWVADWFSESFDARNDSRNPRGPSTGEQKVIRGGGWREPPERLRAPWRMHASPDHRADDIGFRCARDTG